MSRKARFRAALGLGRVPSAAAWAREQGVTPGHLSQVLDGKRDSLKLITKIESFIARQLGEDAA